MRFSCGEIGRTIISLMNECAWVPSGLKALLQFYEGSLNRPAPLRP